MPVDTGRIMQARASARDAQIDLLTADAETIRANWINYGVKTNICGLWAHDYSAEGHHKIVEHACAQLAGNSRFFDTRIDFNRQFGPYAKTCSAVVILDDADLRVARHAADHYVDVHHLRDDLRPIIVQVGDDPLNPELECYFRHLPTLRLPAFSTSSIDDWMSLPLFLMHEISALRRQGPNSL